MGGARLYAFLWYSSARGKCRVYARAQVSKYGDVTPIICFKTNVNIMVCKQNNHFNVQSYCNVSKRTIVGQVHNLVGQSDD